MKRGPLVATVILLAFYGASIVLVAMRGRESSGDSSSRPIPVLRFAHWNLESGVREAFDEVARNYERACAARGQPVRVHQIAIPRRVYWSWAKSQLIGGTAPEIMLSMNATDDQMTAAYFRPLTDVIAEANPYNRGTSLEGIAWRNTFGDGMAISGFNFVLGRHYSIPFATFTTRVFVNLDLLGDLLQDPRFAPIAPLLDERGLPSRWDAFLALCHALPPGARFHGTPLLPLAGSDDQAQFLLSHAFESQTQRYLFEVAPFPDGRPNSQHLMVRLLQGDWHFDSAPVRSGAALMREVGRALPPGFLQLKQDDAIFQFTSGRAVMMVIGTWNAPSIETQIGGRFRVAAFRMPLPGTDHPRFGSGVLGPFSESDAVPSGFLGVVSLHPREAQDRAIDFLRFLTSVPVNIAFSDRTGWLPAVSGPGVEPPARLRSYLPVVDGYPRGLSLSLNDTDFRRLMQVNLHLLFSREDGVDRFIEAQQNGARATAITALRRVNRDQQNGFRTGDVGVLVGGLLGDADHVIKGASLDHAVFQEQRLIERLVRLRRLGLEPGE